MNQTGQNTLKLVSLRKAYGDSSLAVDDVSLDVSAGEFVTLLGPSGSGKTTTLKMIAGFEMPDSGDILLGSRSIGRLAPHARNIGMVFQNYALFPHMTVAENIAFPLRMRGREKSETGRLVSGALDLVKLSGYDRRYPKQLSGGQQQRVALARAIVFRPPLLLMDEPLGALDRQLRKSVQVELKRIAGELGLTVVFVTHDQDEALFLSGRIAIMNQGRIVQYTSPHDIYRFPRNRFVAEFMGESNFIDGSVLSVSGSRVRVRLSGGAEIVGRSAGPLKEKARVDVMVRPDELHLVRAASDIRPDENALSGIVRDKSFVGAAYEYEVMVAGRSFTMRAPIKASQDDFNRGEEVHLVWNSEDGIVFPKEGGA